MRACIRLSSCNANAPKEIKGEEKHCCSWIIKLNFSTTSFWLKNLYLIADQLLRQNLQTPLASARIMDSCDCDDADRFSHKQQAQCYKQSSSPCPSVAPSKPRSVDVKNGHVGIHSCICCQDQSVCERKAGNYGPWLQPATKPCVFFAQLAPHHTWPVVISTSHIGNMADGATKSNKAADAVRSVLKANEEQLCIRASRRRLVSPIHAGRLSNYAASLSLNGPSWQGSCWGVCQVLFLHVCLF